MYITITDRDDGFGAQLQHILFGMMYTEKKGLNYLHKPIVSMAHNYNNDPFFIKKIEDFLNINGHFNTIEEIKEYDIVPFWTLYPFVTEYFDICFYGSNAISNYKSIFWNNKKRQLSQDVMNIAVHVRRFNSCDWDKTRIESDSYFLNLIQKIRETYDGPKIFHIYSQGSLAEFNEYIKDDIVLHLNEDVCDTFLGMVSADILITSKSALSYCAALLTDGIVYFIKFGEFNPPSDRWIICS